MLNVFKICPASHRLTDNYYDKRSRVDVFPIRYCMCRGPEIRGNSFSMLAELLSMSQTVEKETKNLLEWE